MLNVPFAQSTNLCAHKFSSLRAELERKVTATKQEHNARSILWSSGTAHAVEQNILNAMREIGGVAAEASIQGFESSGMEFYPELEAGLVNTFEACFSLGYEAVALVRNAENERFRKNLINQELLPKDSEFLSVVQQAKDEGQATVRRYFGNLKRSQKKWWEKFGPIASFFRLIARLFFKGG